jgi:hypothetical protein
MGHSAYCSNQGTLPTPDRVEPQRQVDPPEPVTEQASGILEAGLDIRTTDRHGQFSSTRQQIANRAATTSGRS